MAATIHAGGASPLIRIKGAEPAGRQRPESLEVPWQGRAVAAGAVRPPRSFTAGGAIVIPVQHIHRMLVHFPIVFFLTLTAFDLIAVIGGRDIAGRSRAGTISTSLAVLAGLSALATFVFGGIALDVAEQGGVHNDIAEIHESLGGITAIAFAVWALLRSFAWWRNVQAAGPVAVAISAIEIAGAALLVVTAYYGGQLVFNLGVNVFHGAP